MHALLQYVCSACDVLGMLRCVLWVARCLTLSGGSLESCSRIKLSFPGPFYAPPLSAHCSPLPPALQVHCARFFYGPMLQGRDGIGAAPCCGTGVVFRRDVLVSIGGQAYGSITEDYNTAMPLLSAGFATM